MAHLTIRHNVQIELDDADVEWARQWDWYVGAKGYVRRYDKVKHIVLLHRALAERWGHRIDNGKEVDHFNRNKLDNTSQNLRVVTRSLNQSNRGRQCNNSSGTTGVSWNGASGHWIAYIWVEKKKIYGGYYADKDKAIAARRELYKSVHGAYPPE